MDIFEGDDKSNKKIEKFIENYGLEDLNAEDLKILTDNIKEMGGLRGMMIQNYIIIRQLDRLNNNLERLKGQEKV